MLGLFSGWFGFSESSGGVAEVEFGDFFEFFGAVGFQKLFSGGVDGFGGSFGEGKAVLFFQFSEPSEEFAPSENGGGGHGEV